MSCVLTFLIKLSKLLLESTSFPPTISDIVVFVVAPFNERDSVAPTVLPF